MAASSDQEFEKQKSSSNTADNCPPITTSSLTSRVEPGQDDAFSTSRSVLNVTLLGSEWNSSEGGLSTFNRELAIYLSKHPKVEVTLLVPEGVCKDEEKREARSYGVTIVEAKKQPGFDPLDWLTFPPKDLSIDVIVGHGAKLGRQAQIIRNYVQFRNCKWLQVVHTAPEDVSKFKDDNDPLSKGEKKHHVEVDLCELADLVIPVGPRLTEYFSSYLRGCKNEKDLFLFTPGLFEREFGNLEQAARDSADFKVLIFGRGSKKDFEVKGYDIAAKVFTDPRLRKKRYRLIFVGAPEGKQDEVRERLLNFGIDKGQLIVREFIQCRNKIKNLLCEVDLAIMPSKSEGFGLVALEALSAGLPILVGSESGFAKALEHVLHGSACIVSSDDPAEWAKKIEAVRVRHGMRLKEIKALKASYGEMYSWKKQCEALVERMWEMVYGSFWETSLSINYEMKADTASENQTEISTMEGHQSQNRRKRKISGTCYDPVIITKFRYQDLNEKKRKIIHETLAQQIQLYFQHRTVFSDEGVSGLIEYIKMTHNVAVESVGLGCLEITSRCPTLESLESLWSDYQSGHLNDIAVRYLATDDIKKKLNMQNVRLTTTIEEENYRNCKKILVEKSVLRSSSGYSPESDQETEDLLQIDPSSEVFKDKKQVLTHMERAERAKASRGPLPKAAISGQCETVKMLLDNGEDVDQRDQFSLTPLHLACWYGQESVVKLLLEQGADVNAEDRFQRTPLQKAERHNHYSIVQLLMNSNARPSYQQPLRLKSLAEKAFLRVDTGSGFNMLTAAVFEGNYNVVSKAFALLDNLETQMGISAVADTLANLETRGSDHHKIESLYRETVDKVNTLSELHLCRHGNDAEKAVELVLNDGLDINTPALCNRTPLLWASFSSAGEFIETLIDLGANVNAQRTDDKVAPVTLSVCFNNFVAVNLLLDHGADVNIARADGNSPLHLAVSNGFFDIAKRLIEKGSDVNLQNKEGRTPLFFGVKNKHKQLIKLLIENEADVNIGYKKNYTETILVRGKDKGRAAWHYVLVKKHLLGLFLKRVKGGRVNVADFGDILRSGWGKDPPEGIIDQILEECDFKEIPGVTVLHIASKENNEPEIIDLLVKSGANVNAQDAEGFTPLHMAAIHGNLKIVKKLVDHEADVNIVTTDGKNAAELAHLNEELEIEEYLESKMASSQRTKEKEVDSELADFLMEAYGLSATYYLKEQLTELNLRSGWGKDPPEGTGDKILKEYEEEKPGVTPLHIASGRINKPEIVDLLVMYGANVNAQDAAGFTPLHMAAIHGNLKIVKKLVDLEADVNIITTDGKNAAELAHLNEELEIEEYLKSKMAFSQRTKENEFESERGDLLIEAYGLPVTFDVTEHFKGVNL